MWLVVSHPLCAATGVLAMWFSYTTCCLQRVRLFDLSLVGTRRELFCIHLSSYVTSEEVKRLLNDNERSISAYMLLLMLLYTSHSQFKCRDQSQNEKKP